MECEQLSTLPGTQHSIRDTADSFGDPGPSLPKGWADTHRELLMAVTLTETPVAISRGKMGRGAKSQSQGLQKDLPRLCAWTRLLGATLGKSSLPRPLAHVPCHPVL